MKISAIIAEYNPFHNGHKYHIEETRRLTGASHVLVVMSGNFTQRGDLAIVPKHRRAESALLNGADLVIELPVAFALSSAEQFASGAVTLLNAVCGEIPDTVLSFGSESGDIDLLSESAGAVQYALTTDEFYAAMKRGKTYPAALQYAVEKYYTDDIVEVLTTPNNTLAVEYLKALSESGSSIKPFTITRSESSHDEHRSDYKDIVSASQLRKMLLDGNDVSMLTPMNFDESDRGNGVDLADISRLETAILAKMRGLSEKDIKKSPNVNGGLENRIFKAARAARNLSELYFLSKTKRYTLARIRRAVLCCFLGITESDVKLNPQYVRILGMNDRGKEILAHSEKCPFPIDTSLSALMNKSDECKRQAVLEDRCTNVYSLAFENRLICGKEFTEKPILF